ncbi:transporter substrate-binding domain-containing protein [Desulfovibrio mangrovi]|uniref:substrate-binding periplasmic protein n=1 Tax=Desulfovibrio mangrovi TaxID=2976983 RepID=UPI002247B918|nr:transporter substrate-binding domain-containing protein [Desulfovibrio mangrovi]UZP66722.1 transporter substrate-binding domain-containing protein [Desulfovibrio mangrovi]
MRIVVMLLGLVLFCSPVKAETYRIATLDGITYADISAMVIKAYARLGHNATVINYPGERALFQSSQGIADAELVRTAIVGRLYPTLVRIPVPIDTARITAFMRKGLPPVRNWEDLLQYRIGVEIGFKSAEFYTRDMNVTAFSDRERMFRVLDAGRLDVVVVLRRIGDQVINRLNLQNVYASDPPLSVEPLYHYVHKKHETLVPELARVFTELLANGTFEKSKQAQQLTP